MLKFEAFNMQELNLIKKNIKNIQVHLPIQFGESKERLAQTLIFIDQKKYSDAIECLQLVQNTISRSGMQQHISELNHVISSIKVLHQRIALQTAQESDMGDPSGLDSGTTAMRCYEIYKQSVSKVQTNLDIYQPLIDTFMYLNYKITANKLKLIREFGNLSKYAYNEALQLPDNVKYMKPIINKTRIQLEEKYKINEMNAELVILEDRIIFMVRELLLSLCTVQENGMEFLRETIIQGKTKLQLELVTLLNKLKNAVRRHEELKINFEYLRNSNISKNDIKNANSEIESAKRERDVLAHSLREIENRLYLSILDKTQLNGAPISLDALPMLVPDANNTMHRKLVHEFSSAVRKATIEQILISKKHFLENHTVLLDSGNSKNAVKVRQLEKEMVAKVAVIEKDFKNIEIQLRQKVSDQLSELYIMNTDLSKLNQQEVLVSVRNQKHYYQRRLNNEIARLYHHKKQILGYQRGIDQEPIRLLERLKGKSNRVEISNIRAQSQKWIRDQDRKLTTAWGEFSHTVNNLIGVVDQVKLALAVQQNKNIQKIRKNIFPDIAAQFYCQQGLEMKANSKNI